MQELTCHAILFDLDGVLVDSIACIERYWRRWAARHGLDSEQILAISHGQRTIDTMYAVASTLNLDLEKEAALLDQEAARDLEGIVAIPGAIELVTALPSESWAVVTSGSWEMATARLRLVGLPIPRAFVTAEEVNQGKPHPEGYFKAASLLGVAPRDCLVIEDAPAGIQAAHSAGIQAIGVTTTFPAARLHEADIVVSDLSNLSLTIRRVDEHFTSPLLFTIEV